MPIGEHETGVADAISDEFVKGGLPKILFGTPLLGASDYEVH